MNDPGMNGREIEFIPDRLIEEPVVYRGLTDTEVVTITNTIMVSMVSAGATIILPSVWLAIMATAGATMVRGMGVAGVGGGAAAGAGAMSGAAGKVGSAAYNKVSNRGAQRGGQP